MSAQGAVVGDVERAVQPETMFAGDPILSQKRLAPNEGGWALKIGICWEGIWIDALGGCGVASEIEIKNYIKCSYYIETRALIAL